MGIDAILQGWLRADLDDRERERHGIALLRVVSRTRRTRQRWRAGGARTLSVMKHYLWIMRPYFRQVAGALILGSLAGIVMNTAWCCRPSCSPRD